MHAGVLSAKLKHIDAWNDNRRKWAARYTAGLQGAKNFTLPVELPGYRHIFHLYVIETKKPEQRDPLVDFLVKNGFDENYGARPLKRAIQKWIEDPLSEKILLAEFSKGDEIEVDLAADGLKLDFRVLSGTPKA